MSFVDSINSGLICFVSESWSQNSLIVTAITCAQHTQYPLFIRLYLRKDRNLMCLWVRRVSSQLLVQQEERHIWPAFFCRTLRSLLYVLSRRSYVQRWNHLDFWPITCPFKARGNRLPQSFKPASQLWRGFCLYIRHLDSVDICKLVYTSYTYVFVRFVNYSASLRLMLFV